MSASVEPIFLEPVFHEMIWGGRRLEDDFGYAVPAGPIGECWAISAHPNGDCRVAGGRYGGMLLSELWETHRDELFPGAATDRFPLLVKIIDAAADLSIQVHPDDAYAAEHERGSLGKRECWYILDCDAGATIVVGQNARSREEFSAMVAAGRWGELLHEVPVSPGDFFQIDPGVVHAIKGGTLILEVQQSSDITYRVYDYGRTGKDGSPRELHLAQSLDVIDYAAAAPGSGTVRAPEIDGITVLESNETYTVERVRVSRPRRFAHESPFLCLSVIGGAGTVSGHDVRKGTHLVVPAAMREVALDGEMELIISHL